MVRSGRQGFGPIRGHVSWAVLLSVALAGCSDTGREASRGGALLELAVPATGGTVERDVLAPQVFQVTESGLWDGRPSLGGVWVAHPTARDPERVLIRNTVTGAEAVGALFRRERENPGPRFQISSEASAALGILAGQPTTLQVTALRLERIEAAPAPAAPAPAPAEMPATAEAVAPAATPEDEAPRRTLASLFRRSAAADPAAPEAAAPAEAQALPPAGVMAITAVDPEPAAPRRGLLDLFRRSERPEAPAGITETALAPIAPVAQPIAPVAQPAAPLAATAMLADEAPRPARHSDPALLLPVAVDPAPRTSFLDLFRRRPAEPAPEAADATQILLPTLAAAPSPQAPSAPARAPAAPAGGSLVQVGIFAVEANARRTEAQMRREGLPAEVRAGRSGEREFWRVVVGPASDPAAQADLLARARALGFADAYAVFR